MRKFAKRFTTHILVSSIIKLGYFSRGLIYLLIGIFALFFSMGLEKKSLDRKEIFSYILHLPFGIELGIILLVGIIGYSLWGFIRAISDFIFPRREDIPLIQRAAYILSGLFYGSLVFFLLALLTNSQVHSSPSLKSYSTEILRIPFGQFFLMCIGFFGVTAGMFEIKKAYDSRSSEELHYHKDKLKADPLFIGISRIGIAIRGFIWTIIGFFGIIAGLFTDISQIKETNDIFASLLYVPFGRLLIGMVAVGFMCFGLYSMSLSFWIDLPKK